MPKLTKRFIDGLTSIEKTALFWDSELRGFGIRITTKGVKSYLVQYRSIDGRSRRHTIGRHGVFTPESARKEAQQLLAAVARGEDPASERSNRRHAATVTELADRYLAEHVKVHNKPRTAKEVERILEKRIKPQLGALKARSVSRADVSSLHHALSRTPREANHTIAILSKMMNLAEGWGLREENTNPCRLVRRYPEISRERYYSERELSRLGQTLCEAETRKTELPGVIRCIRLLALTGCRLGEIRTLRWEYVDLENAAFHFPDAKAGARAHPIGSKAIELLDAIPKEDRKVWVVCGRDADAPLSEGTIQSGWRRIRVHAKLENARLHDLRHTVGTYAGQTGANAFLVRDKLGHRTLAMTGRYVSRDIAPLRNLSDQIEERVANAMSASN